MGSQLRSCAVLLMLRLDFRPPKVKYRRFAAVSTSLVRLARFSCHSEAKSDGEDMYSNCKDLTMLN